MESGHSIEDRQASIEAQIRELIQEHLQGRIGNHEVWLEAACGEMVPPPFEDHGCTATCQDLPEREHRAFVLLRSHHLFFTHIQHEAQRTLDNVILMRNAAKRLAGLREEAMEMLLQRKQ